MLAAARGTDKPAIPKLRLRPPPEYQYLSTDTDLPIGASDALARVGILCCDAAVSLADPDFFSNTGDSQRQTRITPVLPGLPAETW